jgi:hypothetical protein
MGIDTEMLDWSGISAAALGRDLRYAFARVGEFQRFPRAAIVTDKPWLRAVANVGDAALPAVEIRTLGFLAASIIWVESLPARPRSPGCQS